jgi:hypothetical protein
MLDHQLLPVVLLIHAIAESNILNRAGDDEIFFATQDCHLLYQLNTSTASQTHVKKQDKHRSSPKKAKDFLHTRCDWATTPLVEGGPVSLVLAPLVAILPA